MNRSVLPFSIAPEHQRREVGEGSITGTIAFPVMHGLSIAERRAVKEIDRSDEVFLAMAQAAGAIAKDPTWEELGVQVDPIAAYGMVTRIVGGIKGLKVELSRHETIASINHAEVLNRTAQLSQQNDEAVAIRSATALIASRLNGCSEWTDDDTEQLHEGLIYACRAFYQAEEEHMLEQADPEEVAQKLEEELGKLKLELGNLQQNPTGGNASGSSSDISQEVASSPETTSPISLSPSSSKPSTPAGRKKSNGFTTKRSPSPSSAP